MANKIIKMAKELLEIEEDLWFRFDPNKDKAVRIDDFDIYTFEQTWGSTALGFPGIGGQAMTTANTYVFVPVSCNQNCFVYFGGRFAYEAEYCPQLSEDIGNQCVKPCSQAHLYRKDIIE